MWKGEEDFPRGGAFSKSKQDEDKPEAVAQSETNTKDKNTTKGKKGKENKQKRKRVGSDDETDTTSSTRKLKRKKKNEIIDTPLFQCLSPDLCLLGCVREAHEYSVLVSLPGNRVASLPITEVSPAYTQQLTRLAQGEDNAEEVSGADEMFRPGSLLRVVIKSVEDGNGGKTQVKLSCVPSLVNANLRLPMLQNGMLLFGSVSSVEDHGYRVDVGIKGLQTFMADKDTENYVEQNNDGQRLSVGQPLWCVVKLKGKTSVGEGRTINVSADPTLVKEAKIQETTSLNTMLPGMKVTAVVNRKIETGLFAKVNNLEAVIHGSQLPKSPLSYKLNSEIEARVLYVHPVTKVIQLTILPRHVAYDGVPTKVFEDLKKGDIMEAKVTRTEKKGLHLSLPQGVNAFAALSQLTDKSDKPELTSFTKGQSHPCRVMGFNYMEGLALVTLKESIISEKYLTVNDIKVGDIVEGTIKEVMFNGVAVKLAKSIFSFIPGMHLADVPIKHPEKKFEAGHKLKCRVLRVDTAKSKVFLTHKKSLVRSKLPLVSDYSQILPHMELDGVIVAVKERVVIVAFFGDVKGFVMSKDMSTEEVSDPSTMFYVGQVIRTRVVYWDVGKSHLRLSFNFGKQRRKSISESENNTPGQYEPGKLVGATVMSQDKDGYRLAVGPSKSPGLLPFYQLSDFPEVQEILKLALRPKIKLQEVTLFNNRKQAEITLKESFLEAARKKHVTGEFSSLKAGQLHPAVIKNHQDYGMFLELASGHTGLCPNKTLSNLQPASLTDLFKVGQSVITRLAKIDTEKKRFLGSLRVEEVYEGGVAGPLGLLGQYMKARQAALGMVWANCEELACFSSLKVRDVVKVTVTSVFKKGILGELESGAKALATKYHFGGIDPKEGICYEAVVLFVDPLTPCVELTLEPKVVKNVKNRKVNKNTQLRPEQVLKADILLVKPECLLMALRGHGQGELVWVPARRHLNDVETNPFYKIGTFTEVVLKECDGDQALAVLLMNDPAAKAKEEEGMVRRKQAMHSTQPGYTLEAQVRSVHPLQINIISDGVQGRVHVTEATDQPQEGENPLRRYHPEQTLKVKVIGLRDARSQSYLPITKTKPNRSLLECTLIPSKMESGAENLLVMKLHLDVGDKVWVYVIKVADHKVWVQVGLTQQGFISVFQLSHDAAVLNDPAAHFLPGTALHAQVLNCDDNDKVELSLTGSLAEVAEGQEVTAQVSGINRKDNSLLVRLACGRRGVAKVRSAILFAVGQYLRGRVDQADKDSYTLSLLESDAPVALRKKRKRKISVDEPEVVPELGPEQILKKERREKKKNKLRQKLRLEEQKDSGVEVTPGASADDDDDDEEEEVAPGSTTSAPLRLSLPGFSWEGQLPKVAGDGKEKVEEEEEDDDDDQVAPESVKSRKKKKRDEERMIQEYEKTQQTGQTVLETSADFERLVLASPNSSLVWLRFMSHHVELGELERARAVAERALNSISFREEKEKENVWLGYLNMETLYGEQGDVTKLLARAVQYNEPLNIHLRLADMYMAASKPEDAEQQYNLLTRKYKRDKNVWKAYAGFLFKASKVVAARALLQRCITTLDNKDHVEVITRFATLEFSNGDAERGRTMFDNLLASYPGRTDLWSVYVDMVAKAGDIAGARSLLERSVKMKLNTKKLSFLLQKFVRFEETHGTEEQVQRARDMAVEVMDG